MEQKSNFNSKCRLHLTKEQRLPRCVKDVEKVLKTVKSCKSNFKTVLANSRFRGNYFKKVYALTLNVLQNYDYIQVIMDKLQLLEKEKFLRKEIASILIYEILFGTGNLQGASKAVTTIIQYKEDIFKMHQSLQHADSHDLKVFKLPRYARVHTLVTTVPYVVKDLENIGFEQVFYDEDISEDKYTELVKNLTKGTFLIDFHFKDVLVFAYYENLNDLELYQKGHIFLQDKSSYIPIHALNPEPGCAVLDACAAPGMKSLHIASKMENKGVLIACELKKDRFETLKEMLQFGSVKISKLFCKDFKLIDPNDQAFSSVDYILLDPSCSGSGMVNRMDEVTDTKDSKTKERLDKLAGFQIILLKHALKFPSVKRVVYSTCSIHEQENEFVVSEALQAFSHLFKLVPVMPEWSVRGSKNFEIGDFCLRTEPERNLTNGFFVAMFERLDESEQHNNETSVERNKKRKKAKNQTCNQDFKVESSNNSDGYDVNKEKNAFQEDIKKEDDFHYISSGMNEEAQTFEFDSSLTKKRKKKKHSLSEVNDEELKEVETTDPLSVSKKKKKHSDVSKSDKDDIRNNCNVEGHFYDENSENVECSSLQKKKQKKKEILNQCENHSSYVGESTSDLELVPKRKKLKKSLTNSSNFENFDAVEKEHNFEPSSLQMETNFTTNLVDDNSVVKSGKQQKLKDHCISRGFNENSDIKSEKKKHKNDSKDNFRSEFQMCINSGSILGNSCESIDEKEVHVEECDKSTSECLAQNLQISEDCNKKHKRKHKKHSKDRENFVDKSISECLAQNSEISENSSSCKKHKKHSKDKENFVDESISECLAQNSEISENSSSCKKHKKHSIDMENLDKSISEYLAHNSEISENSSSCKKHKRKHKKHSKERENNVDSNDPIFVINENMSEDYNKGKIPLEVEDIKYVSGEFFSESADSSSVKLKKKKKHKKHSTYLESSRCVDEFEKSDGTESEKKKDLSMEISCDGDDSMFKSEGFSSFYHRYLCKREKTQDSHDVP